MASFRDLRPEQRPEEELAPPKRGQIRGETVEEAIARGVPIQVAPIVERDAEQSTRPRWGNDGIVTGRRRGRKPKGSRDDVQNHG